MVSFKVTQMHKNILVKYEGDRFKGGHSPIDVLSGVSHLHSLLLDICEQIIREKGRGIKTGSRVRRYLELSASQLLEGCCEVQVDFSIHENEAPLLKGIEVGSRDALMSQAFARIHEMLNFRGEIPDSHYIPLSTAKKLAGFTKHMRDGEEAIIAPGTEQSSGINYEKKRALQKYVRTVREKLVLADAEITGIDFSNPDKKMLRITAKPNDQAVSLSIVVPALIGAERGNEIADRLMNLPIKVELKEISRLDRDKIYRFERLPDATIAGIESCLKVFDRIDEITKIESGWLTLPEDASPQGSNLTAAARRTAISILKKAPGIAAHLGVFLTEPGGLSMEIRSKSIRASVKISSNGDAAIVPTAMREAKADRSIGEFLRDLTDE